MSSSALPAHVPPRVPAVSAATRAAVCAARRHREMLPTSAQQALDLSLVEAVVSCEPRDAQAALAAGADPDGAVLLHGPNHWPQLGGSLVTYAARQGFLSMTHTLVIGGATLDRTDQSLHRPLHAALDLGDLVLARWLIEAGADPRATDVQGRNALQRATIFGARHLLRAILHHDPAMVDLAAPGAGSALHTAVFLRDLDLMEILLQAGADPLHRTRRGFTALHEAVSLSSNLPQGPGGDRSAPCLRRLLATGVTVAVADGSTYPTLLRTAVWSGSAACVVVLLQHGAVFTDDVLRALDRPADPTSHVRPMSRPGHSVLHAIVAAVQDGTLPRGAVLPLIERLLQSTIPATRSAAVCLAGAPLPPETGALPDSPSSSPFPRRSALRAARASRSSP